MSDVTSSSGVNAWRADDDGVIVALRVGDEWRLFRVSNPDATQLADQLYLLTRTRP